MHDLVDFVKNNKLAEQIFITFALRTRNRKLLNLETFRQVLEDIGVKVNNQEFLDIFKYLESKQIGLILNLKSGLYFKCKTPLRDLGFIGLNEKPFESGETRNRDIKRIPKKPTVRKIKTLTESIIGIPLTNGETITLKIKTGVNKDVIQEFIKKLSND